MFEIQRVIFIVSICHAPQKQLAFLVTAGMSGSLILLSSGRDIGVVSISGSRSSGVSSREGFSPLLAAQLPCWLAGGLLDIPSRPDDDGQGGRGAGPNGGPSPTPEKD